MGQVLSEGEVDALLKGVGEGEVQTEMDQVDDVTGVTAYDLDDQSGKNYCGPASHSGYHQSNVFPVISPNVFGHVTKSSGSQRRIH